MPGKKHSAHKLITEIDSFDECLVWCTSIIDMHRRELFQQLLNYENKREH
jgi:hypothetical protein